MVYFCIGDLDKKKAELVDTKKELKKYSQLSTKMEKNQVSKYSFHTLYCRLEIPSDQNSFPNIYIYIYI